MFAVVYTIRVSFRRTVGKAGALRFTTSCELKSVAM